MGAWRPISDAPRNKWLLVSGGPARNPGAFAWQIATVTDDSVNRSSPPYANAWGGGSYMGVKWYMELPEPPGDGMDANWQPIRQEQKTVTEYVVDVWHSCDTELPPSGVDLEIGYQVDGYLISTAYAVRRGHRWYSGTAHPPMTELRDDLQRPSVWRRPLHQEQRAAS